MAFGGDDKRNEIISRLPSLNHRFPCGGQEELEFTQLLS